MKYILLIAVAVTGCVAYEEPHWKNPGSGHYVPTDERIRRQQDAYWDLPKPLRGPYPTAENERDRHSNLLKW